MPLKAAALAGRGAELSQLAGLSRTATVPVTGVPPTPVGPIRAARRHSKGQVASAEERAARRGGWPGFVGARRYSRGMVDICDMRPHVASESVDWRSVLSTT
jgi:hypothetical protein